MYLREAKTTTIPMQICEYLYWPPSKIARGCHAATKVDSITELIIGFGSVPDEENKCYTATRGKLIFAHAYTRIYIGVGICTRRDDVERDYFSRVFCMRCEIFKIEKKENEFMWGIKDKNACCKINLRNKVKEQII